VILFHNARINTPIDPGRAAGGTAQAGIIAWEHGELACEAGRIAA
jgi:hypothetical protein